MHIWIIIICLSFTYSSNLAEYQIEINQNILRFYHNLPLNHAKSTRAVGHADNTKNMPEDVFVVIAEYLDHSSLLSFSSVCKLFRHVSNRRIIKDISSLNPAYLFPNDQLNRAMHAIFYKNSFFKLRLIPHERIKMLINSLTRYRNILPNLPAPIYNHLVFFLSAVNLRGLNTFQLLNHVQGAFDSIFPNNSHCFHRIFLFRALIDHKNIVVDCFFKPEFLQNVSLEKFNEILFNSLPADQAQKLLKSLNPNFYNQQSQKSFPIFIKQLNNSILFCPSVENFLTILTTTFPRLNDNQPSSLLFTLIRAFLIPETSAKLVLFWYSYTKYFTEYLSAFMFENYIWWSFSFSTVFDVIKIYPEHTDEILELTSTRSVEELKMKFLSELNLNIFDALESSARFGHTTTISFLLDHFDGFRITNLSMAIFRSASTEFTDTLDFLIKTQQQSHSTLLKAMEISVRINNIDSFKLLLSHLQQPIDQEYLNSFFLFACRNHFLEIATILLSPRICPEIFKAALKYASITPNSEIFRFLINQTVYQYEKCEYDELIIENVLDDSDYENLLDLLQYTQLYSQEGILQALSSAIMHKSHHSILSILSYFVIPPQEADKLLLDCINFRNNATIDFLFQVGLKFTQAGLIAAYHSACYNCDESASILIKSRIKLK